MKQHCHLMRGDILLSLTGNVGRACIVCDGKYLLNQRVSKIVAKNEISNSFGYYFFKQPSFFDKMLSIAKGTAQMNLSPIETLKLTQVLPNLNAITRLSKYFEDFFNRIAANNVSSNHLTNLRNTLLPKLISGELKPQNAEAAV